MKKAVSNTKVNAMESFLERYGILKTWIAHQIGINKTTLSQAMWERGFFDHEADLITGLLQTTGKKLLKFEFSEDHKSDIDKLRNEYGIKKSWLANQLGFESMASLIMAVGRQGGLRKEEIETLSLALKDVARAMIAFEFPSSRRKAA